MYWNDYDKKNYVDVVLFLMDLKWVGKIGVVLLMNFDMKCVKEMVDVGAEISTN